MSRPYRPSCGTEGMDFMDRFCDRCTKAATGVGEAGCPILNATFFYLVSDPRYPKEWVQDEAGPRCTAFERVPE